MLLRDRDDHRLRRVRGGGGSMDKNTLKKKHVIDGNMVHFRLQEPNIGKIDGSLAFFVGERARAQVIDLTDQAIVEAVFEAARAEGINDLYLIDRDFILGAIRDKMENTTMNEYQRLAQRTSRKELSPEAHVANGMLGLAGEAGECCDLVKKRMYQDGREIRESLKDELGDVLWYIAEAASGLGLTLEEIAQHNIEKLKKRYPEGFDPERSLHREGEKE